MDLSTNHHESNTKLKWGERLGYGLGGAATRMMFAIIGSYITIYMTNVALVDVAVISTIIAVSKLLDGISDVLIGNIVDHTDSAFGKARIWLMRMSLPFALAAMLLFYVPSDWPDMVKYVYIFVMYNITVTFCFTFLQISHYSLIPLMTSDSEEQGLLGIVRSIFVSVGNLAGSALFVRLLILFSDDPSNQNTQRGYSFALAIYLIFVVLSLAVTIISVKERVHPESVKSDADKGGRTGTPEAIKAIISDRNWIVMTLSLVVIFFGNSLMTTSGTYYALYRMNDLGHFSWMMSAQLIPRIFIQFLMPFVMHRIGKKWSFIAGQTLAAVGSIGLGLATPHIPGMVICYIIKGCGIGAATGVVLGLLADMVTYTYRKKGVFAAGLGSAGVSAADKLGQGIGSAVFGFTLAAAGFDAKAAVQPAAVIGSVSWAHIWIPAICFASASIMIALLFDIEKDA